MVYAGIQGSYKSFHIALFEGGVCLGSLFGEKVQASSQFLVLFDQLLKKYDKTLGDLSFIAVDQGPGAFTSLRVILSTVNGLAFSSNIKLVGVDGLDALALEASKLIDKIDLDPGTYLVPVLNAYNKEVYFGIYDLDGNLVGDKGCKKIDLFLSDLGQKSKKIIFIGNGAELHKLDPLFTLSTCSAQTVGVMGLEQWEQDAKISSELKPIYLGKSSLS
jgi:tRNA threonylcarbamoyl adenosine modification protein YeaZ